ncbi:MAG: M24 family metallopeptidase, partial [Chloroflexota bacterium]
MKSDLDRLMTDRNLDGFIVVTGHDYNAVRDYLTNGARVTGGHIVKRRGEPAHFIVNRMEVQEAAASGLIVHSRVDLGYAELLKEVQNPTSFKAAWWRKMLAAGGLDGGRVGVYGAGDLNVYLELFRMLDAQLDGYELVGETGRTLFDEAMTTKDADEIERIKVVAVRTSEVIALTWDFIASHREVNGVVVDADSEPLTIGDVKRFIRRELLVRELEDTGMIFAQGADGGYPHSRGQDDQPLQTGQSIVFDLFPRELGGGYHHDMTRTWSIGYATETVQTA